MSAETLVSALGQVSDRKTLLRKVGAAGFGSLLFVMGMETEQADAQCFQHGCNLCNPCTPPCPALTCSWCWWGSCHRNPDGSNRHQTLCCEGFVAGQRCAGDTCNVACSYFGGTAYGC